MDRKGFLHLGSSITKIFRQVIILLSAIFCISNASAKQLNIITSTAPIAGIISLVTGDKAKIQVICNNDSCPDHYFIKPSQFFKLQTADLIVYVDNAFEVFMSKATKSISSKTLQLSKVENIKLVSNNLDGSCPSCDNRQHGNFNWHLWLSIDNILLIMQSIKDKVIELDPENQNFYQEQCSANIAKLEKMGNNLEMKISKLPKPIIIFDNSLAYLFDTIGDKQIISLKASIDLNKMHQVLKQAKGKCAFTTFHQPNKALEKVMNWDGKIIYIENEKWLADDLQNMVEQNMNKIIHQIEQCLTSTN